jgi:hypothetical protein
MMFLYAEWPAIVRLGLELVVGLIAPRLGAM